MWVCISACRVGGQLIQPGESLPDLTAEQAEALERARCVERVKPPTPGPAREAEKPKPRRRKRN